MLIDCFSIHLETKHINMLDNCVIKHARQSHPCSSSVTLLALITKVFSSMQQCALHLSKLSDEFIPIQEWSSQSQLTKYGAQNCSTKKLN